jgi:hypothetical protein
MTTEQRLARLERENRWIRRIGAVCLALVAAVFLMGQDKAKELPDLEVRSLEVRTLVVKDKDGKVRAALRARPDGAPTLSLSDKDGGTRALLATWPDGSPGLCLYDKDSKRRALLALRLGDGSPSLRLFDAKGKLIWEAPKD